MHRTRHDESRFARHAGFAALPWHFAVRGAAAAQGVRGAATLPARRDRPPPGYQLLQRPSAIAADLVFEARRTEAPGVFADFEHDTPLNRRLLAAFDEALYDADIPLYVPLECGRTLSHAILTVSTAISGGSLTEYISSLQGIYSAARIAAFLQPVSQDFTLPSPTPNGISLSAAARAALLAQTGAQPFFSRELCAKYFTYMDADGQAHFVLYDDDSTLAAKLAQLAGCGVQNVFALFPDAAGLLKPQT